MVHLFHAIALTAFVCAAPLLVAASLPTFTLQFYAHSDATCALPVNSTSFFGGQCVELAPLSSSFWSLWVSEERITPTGCTTELYGDQTCDGTPIGEVQGVYGECLGADTFNFKITPVPTEPMRKDGAPPAEDTQAKASTRPTSGKASATEPEVFCGWNGYDFSSLASDDVFASDGHSRFHFCAPVSSFGACTSQQSSACTIYSSSVLNVGSWMGFGAEWGYLDAHNPALGVELIMKGEECMVEPGETQYSAHIQLICSSGEQGPLTVHSFPDVCAQVRSNTGEGKGREQR